MKNKNKFGFTLAEVLITLVIIGVVAALTIPTAIQKYHEKQLYTAYVRVYGILGQAYLLARNQYGDYDSWEDTSVSDYEKIRPYFKVSADCPTGRWSGDKEACFPTDCVEFDGTTNLCQYFLTKPAVRLASGESVLFERTGHRVSFVVDLNGDRGPNKLGEDIHHFSVRENTIFPGPIWGGMENSFGKKHCQRNPPAGTWHPGSGCGFWIRKYGNMDYLHLSDEQIAAKW